MDAADLKRYVQWQGMRRHLNAGASPSPLLRAWFCNCWVWARLFKASIYAEEGSPPWLWAGQIATDVRLHQVSDASGHLQRRMSQIDR